MITDLKKTMEKNRLEVKGNVIAIVKSAVDCFSSSILLLDLNTGEVRGKILHLESPNVSIHFAAHHKLLVTQHMEKLFQDQFMVSIQGGTVNFY